MKLSLIIPTYMGEKFVKNFIYSLNNQTDKGFELIFIVDNTKDNNSLNTLIKLKREGNIQIKILFNSKRQKRLNSIMSGVVKASGEYVAICSMKDIIANNFIKKINDVITKHKPDVIEYKFKYAKQKVQPALLAPTNTLVNCKKNPAVIAYTIPFDFNKVIKRKLALKFISFKFSDGGSRFDFSFIFDLMLAANSYFAINSTMKTTEVSSKTLINPRRMLKLMNNIIDRYEFMKNDNLHDAVLHFAWSSLSVFQMQVLIAAKKPVVVASLYGALKKFKSLPAYKQAYLQNDYFLKNSLAGQLIKFYPSSIKNYKKIIMKKVV